MTAAMTQLPASLSPLSPEQHQQVQSLMTSLTPVQKAWISGYLAGGLGDTPAPAPEAAPATLTVLYGSQAGNARHVAQDLAGNARSRGMDVRLTDMADYKPNQLKNERFLSIVVSTYGEGEPPEGAQKLYDFLASKKSAKTGRGQGGGAGARGFELCAFLPDSGGF